MTAAEKAAKIVEYADDMKAQDIENIDVHKKTSITSHMVVCTGTSATHANAIIERVREKMREEGVRPRRRDASTGGWLLLDFGDVILHVMLEERRQFYDLETLWSTMRVDPSLQE